MKIFPVISISIVITFFACKKTNTETDGTPPTIIAPNTFLPTCANLPPTPDVFGWKDSSITDDKNVNAFRFNPFNSSQIIYIVNGDAFAPNKMFLYEYSIGIRTYLGNCGEYLPDINAKGWIVFNRQDNNIYKVKINGDSLSQLTNNYLCSDPKWDASGQFIYCYQKTSGTAGAYLNKLNSQGQLVSSTPIEYPNTVPSKTTNNIYYLKTVNDRIALFLRNQATNTEILLVTSKNILNGVQNDFFNLNRDPSEKFLYWTNSSGVIRFTLQNFKTDTLLKNCPNYTFLNPIVSSNSESITFSCKILTPLNVQVLYREYRTFELDLSSSEWRELRLFAD